MKELKDPRVVKVPSPEKRESGDLIGQWAKDWVGGLVRLWVGGTVSQLVVGQPMTGSLIEWVDCSVFG